MSYCSAGYLYRPSPFNYRSRFALQFNYSKMRQGKMRCLLLLCFVLAATGFSLFDLKTSYVQFERFSDTADGKTGVSFRCKTYVTAGMLFYVDRAGLGEYLTLYLRDGFLILELRDGDGITFKVKSKIVINDLEWHKIDVELSSNHAAYRLDNVTQAELNITKLQLKSDIYIGGFPHDVDIFSMSHDEMMFVPRFMGCVENVNLENTRGNGTRTNAKLLRSAGMDLECKDACKPKSPCNNRGVCINKFAVAECVCTGTGYYGKACEKESSVVGISSADHRVIFDVVSSYVEASSVTTSLSVRVRSSQSDGVFFYTAHKGDFILLKLASGRISASVNVGSGSVTIESKVNTYDDNQWHHVKLGRIKRLVNLTVDNSDTSTGMTKGVFYQFHIPKPKMSFILGGPARDDLDKNERNFTGCLQELFFNGYDLFGKYNKSSKEVTSRGKFLKTCPKAPTTPPKVATTISDPSHRSTRALGTKTTKASSAFSVTLPPTTSTKLPCSVTGISGENTTAGGPTSQAHTVTSSRITHASTSSGSQSWISSETGSQSTVRPKKTTQGSSNTNPDSSKAHFPTSKSARSLSAYTNVRTSQKISTKANGGPRATEEVKMASQRGEGDLTIYFIVAAIVGLLAFLLAILIIVKVNWASKKKYAVRGQNYEKDYWADTGSFQRSTKESKPLV